MKLPYVLNPREREFVGRFWSLVAWGCLKGPRFERTEITELGRLALKRRHR